MGARNQALGALSGRAISTHTYLNHNYNGHLFISGLHLFVCLFCVGSQTHARGTWNLCGGQRTVFRSQCSPSVMEALGIELEWDPMEARE